MRRLLVSLVGLTSPLVRSYAVTPSLQRLPHIRGGSRHTTSTAIAVDIEQLIVERTESVRAPPLDTRTYRHVTLAIGPRALLVHDAEADHAAAAIEVLRRELVSSRLPRPDLRGRTVLPSLRSSPGGRAMPTGRRRPRARRARHTPPTLRD